MLIQYCSDLHLEFPINKTYAKNNPLKRVGEILILAGDIIPLSTLDQANDFFDFVSDQFQHVYWVPGNHEYYHSDLQLQNIQLKEQIRSNVTLINNGFIHYKGIRLLFSTLWSEISAANESVIVKSMADFRLIKNEGRRFSVADFNNLHGRCKHFLTKELSSGETTPTIVVTHHIPTLMNYPERYRNSKINEAFAVELHDLIESSHAAYWISGHSHEVVPDFKIGKTTLTSNQLGYVEYGEHKLFSNTKCINLIEL
jgi:predicted phosphohydrolase